MGDLLRRVFVYALVSSLCAYLLLMIIGATLYARADDEVKPVWVRDEISPNTHRIAGLVTVPSSCTELTEKTEQLSPLLYKLAFTTWEHPNTECTDYPVQKQFYEIVFAPAVGVTFIATLDGKPLPLIVVPYVP
jgi:hypothetical protein